MTTTPTTQELIEELTHESIHIRDGQCDDEFHSELLTKAAQRLRELDKPDCIWTNGEADEVFETQCGNAYTFIDGGISENDCKFCQYCGGAVKEAT